METNDATTKMTSLRLDNDPNACDWVKDVTMTEILFVRHAESFNNALQEFIRKKYGKTSQKEIEEYERLHRQTDATLSEKGFKQIECLKKFTKNGLLGKAVNSSSSDMSDWLIISSPMVRCLITSQAIAEGLGHKTIYVHPELYESGGCHGLDPDSQSDKKVVIGLPGSTKQDIESNFPYHKCLPGMENGWYHGKPKEETQKQFQTRAKRIVDWLWEIHNTEPDKRKDLLKHSDIGTFKNIIIVNHGNLLNGMISGLQLGTGNDSLMDGWIQEFQPDY